MHKSLFPCKQRSMWFYTITCKYLPARFIQINRRARMPLRLRMY